MHLLDRKNKSNTISTKKEWRDGEAPIEDEQLFNVKEGEKYGFLGPKWKKYDATGLVPYYTEISEVPVPLQKYFLQRTKYFSLYSKGCLLDGVGWFSITPEYIANHIAARCRCDVVLDAFCGVGGNSIAFAKTCSRVIALDNSPLRLALARHNAIIYGVADKIEFVLADYVAFVNSQLPYLSTTKIDVIFLSPPWNGPAYLAGSPIADSQGVDKNLSEVKQKYSLDNIVPLRGADLYSLSRKITEDIAFYLPEDTDLQEVSALVEDDEMIEVEKEWIGSKPKAITCYFGKLAKRV